MTPVLTSTDENGLSVGRPRLTMVWHEALNSNYYDRYPPLGRLFDLEVLGPRSFMGKKEGDGSPQVVKLFRSVLSGHWLTYICPWLLKHVFSSSGDILYIHEEPHSLMAALCCSLAKDRFVVIESSVINRKGNFWKKNPLEKYVYKRADVVLPKNHEVAAILAERGCAKSKIAQPVGNGVSTNTYAPVAKLTARAELASLFPEVRQEFGRERLVLGYAGRIWEAKGLRLLPDLAEYTNSTIVVCGETRDPALERHLRNRGVICLGSLSKKELRTFYSALDLFVLPSLNTPGWREQFGRVCIEAIYCGTPAIGSAVGGIPMVVGESQVFSPGSLEDAQRLVRSLSPQWRRDEVLAWQRSYVETNFSWDALANAFKDMYDRSVQSASKRELSVRRRGL